MLRAEPRVYGRVASDPTVSRVVDALAAAATQALTAINAARAAARATVWQLAGRHAPDHDVRAEHPLAVDIHATRLRVAADGRLRAVRDDMSDLEPVDLLEQHLQAPLAGSLLGAAVRARR